ncbi:hypothetical protein TcCL_ESM10627 [Trypanosoma cruzi]|nr:hypothetical protein TcCL_ESM10627 [Trypanosoma cruzi]
MNKPLIQNEKQTLNLKTREEYQRKTGSSAALAKQEKKSTAQKALVGRQCVLSFLFFRSLSPAPSQTNSAARTPANIVKQVRPTTRSCPATARPREGNTPGPPGNAGKKSPVPRHSGGLPLGSSLCAGGLRMVCLPVRPHDPGQCGNDGPQRPCPTGPRNANFHVRFSPRPPGQARRSCGNVAGASGRTPLCVGGAAATWRLPALMAAPPTERRPS